MLSNELLLFPIVAVGITLNVLDTLFYQTKFRTFIKNKGFADGPTFIVGLLTIMKQFHPRNQKKFILCFSHYIKNVLNLTLKKSPNQKQAIKVFPEEVQKVLTLMGEFVRYDDGISRETIS
jgi:hypothetical protein